MRANPAGQAGAVLIAAVVWGNWNRLLAAKPLRYNFAAFFIYGGVPQLLTPNSSLLTFYFMVFSTHVAPYSVFPPRFP